MATTGTSAPPPRVSIVTATYNRSNVLRYAVARVLCQTLTDWELLVVGDACTDDTAEVVDRFDDERIRFTNLPRNHGEQSAPNNAGVALASGTYLAFLNHDDLWFSDHLSTLVAAIEQTGADLVYSLSARVDAEGRVHLWGDSPGGRYAMWHVVPASIWLMRRELATRVGPWTSGGRLLDAPSQEWLRRAHASGAKLKPVRRLTAVQITSGGRRNSYRNRDDHEHAAMAAAFENEASLRERLLTEIAAGSSRMTTYVNPAALASRTLQAAAARSCAALGIPPVAFFNLLRYGRRGGFIRHIRGTRGLPPAPLEVNE